MTNNMIEKLIGTIRQKMPKKKQSQKFKISLFGSKKFSEVVRISNQCAPKSFKHYVYSMVWSSPTQNMAH